MGDHTIRFMVANSLNLQSNAVLNVLLNCVGFIEMARYMKKSKCAHSKYKQFSVKKMQNFNSSCLLCNFSEIVSN